MKTNLFRITRIIAIVTLCLHVNSCQLAYNSIHYSKADGNPVNKTKYYSQKKMKENVTFVHAGDSIYQLENVEYSTNQNELQEIKGNKVEYELEYLRAYSRLKQAPKAKISNESIAGPKAKYIKQTHIFVDSAAVTDGNIKISENRIEEVRSYHKSKTSLYILLAILTLPLALLILLIVLIVDISNNGLNLGFAV